MDTQKPQLRRTTQFPNQIRYEEQMRVSDHPKKEEQFLQAGDIGVSFADCMDYHYATCLDLKSFH